MVWCVSEGVFFFLFGGGLTFAGWGEEEEPCLRLVEVVVEVCMIPGWVGRKRWWGLFVWMERWLWLVMRRIRKYYGTLWPGLGRLYTDRILHVFMYTESESE